MIDKVAKKKKVHKQMYDDDDDHTWTNSFYLTAPSSHLSSVTPGQAHH